MTQEAAETNRPPDGVCVERVRYSALLDRVCSSGWARVFGEVIVNRVPQGEGWGARCVMSAQVVGCIVSGPEYDLFQAQGDWLFADSLAVAQALVSAWSVAPPCGRTLFMSSQWGVAFEKLPTSWERGLDQIWAARCGGILLDRHQPRSGGVEICWVDEALLDVCIVPEAFQPYLVRSDIRAGMRFAACIVRLDTALQEEIPRSSTVTHRICAIAEIDLDTGHAASIQQVFTDPTQRRRGYAAAVVRFVTRTLHSEGKDVTYHVDATNRPSITLAAHLGFVHVEDLVWVSSPTE